MATFTWTPDFGAQKTTKPTVSVVKFGDGYESRVKHGINTNQVSWSLRFGLRDDEEIAEIEEFLADKEGVEAFEWTPPTEDDASNFVCREWSKSLDHAGRSTISATFEEVFEP
jgi:phage-related protein